MADADKVTKALELCASGCDDNGCVYLEEQNNRGGLAVCRCVDLMAQDALELLKEQPHWIPVEERLPKSMANKVIVYLQHEDYVPEIGYGHYEKYKGEEMWYNLETDEQFIKRGYKVTHWMPMPKSPEGEKLILT